MGVFRVVTGDDLEGSLRHPRVLFLMVSRNKV